MQPRLQVTSGYYICFNNVNTFPSHPCGDPLWGALALPAWYIPFHCEFHLSLCSIGTVFPERWSPLSFVLFHLRASVTDSLLFSPPGCSLRPYTNTHRLPTDQQWHSCSYQTTDWSELITPHSIQIYCLQSQIHQNIKALIIANVARHSLFVERHVLIFPSVLMNLQNTTGFDTGPRFPEKII